MYTYMYIYSACIIIDYTAHLFIITVVLYCACRMVPSGLVPKTGF